MMRKGISLAGTCEVKEAEQSGPLSFCCCRGWLRKMHVFFRMIAVCGRAKKQLACRGIDVLEILKLLRTTAMVKSFRSVPGSLLVFADFEAQAKMLIWKES